MLLWFLSTDCGLCNAIHSVKCKHKCHAPVKRLHFELTKSHVTFRRGRIDRCHSCMFSLKSSWYLIYKLLLWRSHDWWKRKNENNNNKTRKFLPFFFSFVFLPPKKEFVESISWTNPMCKSFKACVWLNDLLLFLCLGTLLGIAVTFKLCSLSFLKTCT